MVVDAIVAGAAPEAMKPHVAVLSSPGMGHVIPMFELAKRLVIHHACQVTFLHIATEASATQTQLLHSPSLPHGLHVLDLPPADLSTVLSEETPFLSHLCLNVRESLRCLKATLLQLQNPPRAVIIDGFCTQAFDICNELSIPAYVLSTTSTVFLAFSLFCRKLDREVSGEFLDLPGCAPLRTRDLSFAYNGEDHWFSYHACRLPMAAGIFMNTWEDLEPVPVKAIREHPFYQQIPTPPVHPIGPLVRESEPITGTGTGAECLAWLDKQPLGSVLFVALGSGGNVCAEQLTELACGLELSQKRFLWVVRPPANVSGTTNYFTVGGEANNPKSYLPEGFLERTREVGTVVPSWAPQVSVLQHRSTGAFLSHCGWNSVLESLCHGVPMITWPLYSDQRMNATMLAEDVGVAIKPAVEQGRKVIGRNEIERVVRAVMEGEEGTGKGMRDRARKLKESASKAVEECRGTGYDALAAVVNQWKAMS